MKWLAKRLGVRRERDGGAKRRLVMSSSTVAPNTPKQRIEPCLFVNRGFLNCALAIVIVAAESPLSGANASQSPPVEQFKSFLEECPSVKSIVMRRKLLTLPSIPGHQLPRSLTNEFQLYEGAWQSSAFYLRQLRDLNERSLVIGTNTFTADLLFNGRVEDRWWDIINTQISSWTPASKEDSSPIRPKVMIAENILHMVMHFGIHDLETGSLHWQDNHFTAKTTSGNKIHGELHVSKGYPKKLTIYNSSNTNSFYECEYEYDASLLGDFLPSKIRRYQSRNGVRTGSWVAHILSINVVNEPVGADYFSPERFVTPTDVEMFMYSNSSAFKVISNSLLHLPPRDAVISESRTATSTTRLVVVGLFAISTISTVLFLSREFNRKNEPTRTRKDAKQP